MITHTDTMVEPSDIGTILTLFLAFGALVVAYFEHKERIKIETRPNIAIFHTLGSQNISLMEVHIKNYGPGIARNVKFTIIAGEDFITPSGESIKDLNIMKNGIDTLGREEERFFVITNLRENYVDMKMNVNITISVTYENDNGESFTTHKPFNIPFNEFHGLRYSSKLNSATPEYFAAATSNTEMQYYSDPSGNIQLK
jgi:hypothetical protein